MSPVCSNCLKPMIEMKDGWICNICGSWRSKDEQK